MPRRPLALALACLVLVACGGYDGPPVFELGTGEDEFEPVEDGVTLPVASGSQGGRHVWVAGRVLGTEDDVRLVFDIVHAETGAELVGRTRRQIELSDGENDEFSGVTAELPFFEEGDFEEGDPFGQAYVIRATLTDAAGLELEDELRFVLGR